MSDDRSDEAVEGDCTLPPDDPVPADQLGQYSPECDYGAEREIARYVEREAPDEAVQHVERVKVEYVMGTPYEVWDVTTDKDRYWVLSNMRNFYSQRHFPSLDYTLSFHIGLMTRLRSREEHLAEGSTPFDEVLRRLHQAEDTLDRAVEAADFQSVGMQLREGMISLMAAARRRTELSPEIERPQDANVVAWSGLLFDHYCPGRTNKELRQYLKATTERAWGLVNWLTHHRNANKTAALIAKHAVDTIVVHMAHLSNRGRWDRTGECPRCGSRAVRTFFDHEIGSNGAYFDDCGECSWNSHPGYDADLEALIPSRSARRSLRLRKSRTRNGFAMATRQ
jgi:hypothetical protein